MINFRYYTLFFKIIIFFELTTYLFSIIRLTKVFNTTLFTRFFVIIPSLIAIFILLNFLKKIRFDFFTYFIFTLLIHSINMALLHWDYTDTIHYQLYYMISETSMIVFALFVYLFTLNIDFTNLKNHIYLENLLDKISFYILLISTITIFTGYFLNIFTSYHLYLSISGKFLLIPFIWSIIRSNRNYLFYTLLLIFLGGKFGVLVAALIVAIFIYKFKKGISSTVMIVYSSFFMLFFIFILYIIKDYQGIGIIDKINGNYNFFNIDPDNLIMFAGGRFIEIFSVFNDFSFSDYLWGKGIGYEYLDIQSGEDFIHNVHITPLGLVSKFGFFMTIILYSFIIFYLFQGSSMCRKDSIYIFFKSILIGMLVFSLTEYAFFVNLIIWMSLGYIANRSKTCVE